MIAEPGPSDWQAVAALAERVLATLDWRALGAIYFHADGEAHWRERRPRVLELGVALAQRLLPQLPSGGASLWVGAGVAELPVLLAETLLRGRTVVAANLLAEECALLNRGLEVAAPSVGFRYLPEDARTAGGACGVDHVGCISVFTDPVRWPVLSGVAYGRLPPVQLDVERFVAEREDATALAEGLFARLVRPGLVTTSAEEVAWFLDRAAAHGASIEAADDLVETAVVGDPVGFLRVD